MKKISTKTIAKAIANPAKAVKYLKLNRDSRSFDQKIITTLSIPPSRYKSYQQEILSSGIIADIEQKLNDYQKKLHGELRGTKLGTGAMNLYQGIKLYALIRHLQPEKVVETGICNGASSTFILAALAKNGTGQLYSIDFPDVLGVENQEIWEGKGSSVIPEPGATGWIIPQPLKERWSLVLGRSQEKLPPLLEELETIDLFIHDSEHSYECMTFEFEQAYPRLRPGGILASHDIDDNPSFQDFARRIEKPWTPIDHYMGFLVK